MSGSSVTQPKGRPTRARNDGRGRRSVISPMLQWTLVVLAGLAVLAAIWYFGSDIRSDLGNDGTTGAPVAVASHADVSSNAPAVAGLAPARPVL